MANSARDQNRITTISAVSSSDSTVIVPLKANPATGRLLTEPSGSAVTGPGSSTDNAVVRFDGTGGATLQNSAVIIDDSGNVTGLGTLNTKALPSGSFVGTTDTQTLTNKTLTAPIIASISNTGTLTLPTATDTLVGRATTDTLTNKTLTAPVISTISNTGTLTLPTSTDTLVGRATTDTLTNKTLTAPVISTISNTGTLTLPTSTDTLVGRATTDTLTNKTLTSPVISTISNTGTLTLPTSTDTLVGRATTDTLTNKTLTAPKIANAGFIADANGNEQIVFNTTASAVTYVDVTNGATGNGPTIKGAGETNTDLYLDANGIGIIRLLQALLKQVVALSDGANIATDASLGNIFTVTLGGSRTMNNPTNAVNGQMIMYRLKQDATGSRTITWGSNFRGSTDVALPTLTTTANAVDYVLFIYNSSATKWDCLAVNKGFAS